MAIVTLQKARAKLKMAPQLTDAQAKQFWKEVGEERKKSFSSPGKAVRAPDHNEIRKYLKGL